MTGGRVVLSVKAAGVSKKHAGTGKHHAFHKHNGTRKHRPQTAAQKAAAKRWQQAGAHAAHNAAVARKSGNPPPPKWSPHMDVACCAAESLAASLRLAGHEVTDRDMLDLYWLTAVDADSGAGLWETIEAAAEFGLAGVRPLDAWPAAEMESGVVLGVDLAERHAVTLDGHGVWSWGTWRPVPPSFLASADEAWVITWP